MSQIFHPSLNTISRITIFGAVIVPAGAILLGGMIVRSPYLTEVGVVRVQPIPFSHQHHVGDVGIDCRYCHQTVETSAFAGLPSTELCLDCHSQLWRDSPMLAPLRESRQTNRSLRWTRVHDLPDYVYFHHGIHVRKGIRCAECHGDVDRMPLMYREHTLHMEWCLDCHRHPEEHVRPRSSVALINGQQSEQSGDEQPAVVKRDDADHLQSKTNCSVCHR